MYVISLNESHDGDNFINQQDGSGAWAATGDPGPGRPSGPPVIPWQRSSASCFGKLRHSRSFQKTSQLRGIPVLGMGEQSCAGLGGTGTPGLGVLVCSYRVFHMV